MNNPTRRVLAWVMLASALAASNCSVSPDDGGEGASEGTSLDSAPDADAKTDADTNTETETKTDGAPPPSWVDVIGVDVTEDAQSYSFSVTIESSDIDCSEFADWWEVLSENGELIYRRILTHPHTDGMTGNPVTRSGGPVEISGGEVVIVRGHMNNAGYVGMAMRGSADLGFTDAPDITSAFHPEAALEGEQPGDCIPEEDIMGL